MLAIKVSPDLNLMHWSEKYNKMYVIKTRNATLGVVSGDDGRGEPLKYKYKSIKVNIL